MEKENKKVFYIAIFALLLVMGGITYAFYTANVNKTNTSNNITVNTANLTLTYNANLSSVGDIKKPDDIQTNKFTVRNTSAVTINSYKVNFTNVNNTTIGNDYVYTLACVSYVNYGTGSQAVSGTCSGKTETPIPKVNTTMITSTAINAGITHEYTMVVRFKETGVPQDDNQGKVVSYKLIVE